MLRSLIIQILQCVPEEAHLVSEELLPYKYDRLASQGGFPIRWDLNRLSDVLQSLLDRVSQQQKLCFIIDGLDEYEGNPVEQERLTKLLTEFSLIKDVKVLLSSRPEAHLHGALKHYPTLKLQDLTAEDIRQYADTKLRKNSWFQQFYAVAPRAVHNLVRSACVKADGVFLWLSMAVQELIVGLTKLDTLPQLWERLEGMNGTLNGLFRQCLNRIDAVHRKQAALCFNILMYRVDASAVFDGQLSILSLAFALKRCRIPRATDHSLGLRNDPRDVEQSQILERTLIDLESACLMQCAGLLDVRRVSMDRLWKSIDSTQDDLLKTYTHFSASFVGFIHRSAYDFFLWDEAAQAFFAPYGLGDEQIKAAALRVLTGSLAVDSAIINSSNLDHSSYFMRKRMDSNLSEIRAIDNVGC